jgi:predicted dehydrogenase
MSTQKVIFGILGASNIAESHIVNLRKCKEAEIKYIYSRDISRGTGFFNKYKINPTDDYKKILSDMDIDAVIITTEPERHVKLAIEAIKYGKHVLIEKPLSQNIKMAEKLLNKTKSSNLITSVVSPYRFDPEINRMKNEMTNDQIGKPFFIETKMLWNRSMEYYKNGNGWRGEYGNVLINQGIHLIDVIIWFFGMPKNINSNIFKIKSNIKCYDNAILTLEFKNNIWANMIFSTSCNVNQNNVFKIYGSKGKLVYDEKDLNRQFANRKKLLDPLTKILRIENEIKRVKTLLQLQIEDFIYSIKNNLKPLVTVEEAYKTLIIINECENAYKNNFN